jgi:phosphoribosyl-AMP cyclohydrolase
MINKDSRGSISIKQLFESQTVWPVIVIENTTGRVVSLQEVNLKAFEKTLETGQCWYWDKVNEVIYLKGEHSNEIETLREATLDICHGRRHLRNVHYRVDIADGACLFGMDRCDFYVFDGSSFVVNRKCIKDEKVCKDKWERVTTILSEDDDAEHQKRFMRKNK